MKFDFGPLTTKHNPDCAELLGAAFERSSEDMLRLLEFFQAGYEMVAYGAWNGSRLAAQYSCLVGRLALPNDDRPRKIGISMNMAVHPDYRGQGLVKHVARPVYDRLAADGAIAGVGFSNKQGVQVDRRSKSYGYQVVGQLATHIALLNRRPDVQPLRLSNAWPDVPLDLSPQSELVRFATPLQTLRHRFGQHPFLPCQFGVWQQGKRLRGITVYRPARVAGLKAVTLLAAYGEHLPGLVSRWYAALWQSGIRAVHCLTSLQAPLGQAISGNALSLRMPYTRSPYYLTVKPLDETTSALLFDFSRWDCVGGDIL